MFYVNLMVAIAAVVGMLMLYWSPGMLLNTVDCCRRLRSRLPAEQRRPKPPAAVVLFTCIINILYDEHGTKALTPSIQ